MVDEDSTMSSSLTSETGPTISSVLQPEVTRIDEINFEASTSWKIIGTTIVVIVALVTVSCNTIILVAFSKFKRLRTASNCLLVSLAISDCGVGLTLPYSTISELYGYQDRSGEGGLASLPAGLCALPYYILIVLCSVSVLVSVAIAVDRLTSLAQPLRYKNIITHSSIERYIAVFWLYATAMGFSPVIHARIFGSGQSSSGGSSADGQSCRFGYVVKPPVRMFLFAAVWAPSALILTSCYVYVYLVARAHAKAIYTVELSFRNEMQTLVLPRYGQTIAFTVGTFFVLWLPFQLCVIIDFFWGTDFVLYNVPWLGLTVLAHSTVNPWIYAFHHGEIRTTAVKFAEKVVTWFGVTPSRYGCSPTRRGSNTNLELAEVNNSQEERRPPIQDCFAAQQHPPSSIYPGRKGIEVSSKNADISPEDEEKGSSSESFKQHDVVEQDIHDLTKMLDPEFIVDRNHVIDSNHNIDKIKNLKYLLDPTFNKIRHLRRLNHKRLAGKGLMRFHDSRFVSYQNLKTDGTLSRKNTVRLNTMSDPMLSADSPLADSKTFNEIICHHGQLFKRKASNFASVSDSNIKETIGNSEMHLRLLHANRQVMNNHRYSVQNLDNRYIDHHGLVKSVVQNQHAEQHRRSFSWARARQRLTGKCCDSPSPTLDLRFQQMSYTSLPTPDGAWSSSRGSPKQRASTRHLTITPNRLANLFHPEHTTAVRPTRMEPTIDSRLIQARKNLEILKHAESTSTLPGQMAHMRLLEPSRIMDSLAVPTIHSEPPSPIDPLPLDALQEEDSSRSTADVTVNEKAISPLQPLPIQRNMKSPTRHSEPVIPSVLLNIEDYSDKLQSNHQNTWSDSSSMRDDSGPVSPRELSDFLLRCSSERRDSRFADTIFPEHDSTRFSSRRPSDSKWSESSRSQELLSNVTEHPRFPSSFSVNNFQSHNSGSDLNDLTSCLEPFMCSDALSSSLHESFFSAPSAPDSEDIFTSFDTDNEPTPELLSPRASRPCSTSSVNLVRRPVGWPQQQHQVQLELQSKSTESMFRDREQNERLCAILRLEPSIHRSRPRVRPVTCKEARLAPLATPTPTDVCTPTFDITVVADIKAEGGVGVRV